jgi:uncharacterized protein YfeS
MYPLIEQISIMENYGINREFGHPKAISWFPEDFFWDCTDELAPFGSDEGDCALAEFRNWRKKNINRDLKVYLADIINSIGQMRVVGYSISLTSPELIKQQIEDTEFDDRYFIDTLDTTIIATIFGQFVDEGKIDKDVMSLAQIAIRRQLIYSSSQFRFA